MTDVSDRTTLVTLYQAGEGKQYVKFLHFPILFAITDPLTHFRWFERNETDSALILGIYELMDKVLLIDEGRMVYQGPAKEAKQYMIDLGFYCPDRETTADFLAGVTDPKQRMVRKGYEACVPRSPEDFEKAYKSSPTYNRVLADLEDYEKHLENTGHQDTEEFKESVKGQQSRHVSSKSSFTVSFWRQVLVSLNDLTTYR